MRSFWAYFFGWLTVLLLLLGISRPDQLDNALNWIGIYLSILAWMIAALLVIALFVVAGIIVHRQSLKARRPHDGAFPLQKIRVGGMFSSEVIMYNPNNDPQFATLFNRRTGQVRQVEPVHGNVAQLNYAALVERSNSVRAMFPGDDARTDANGATSKLPSLTAAAGRFFAGNYDKPPKMVELKPDDDAAMPALIDAATAAEGASLASPSSLPLGADTETGNAVMLDLSRDPHVRIHGQTQGSGKTNLLKQLAANGLRQGNHVLVLDRRRFKDWSQFSGKAELVDTRRPGTVATAVDRLYAEYERRDALLAAHGAPNIASLPGKHKRIMAIVSEFGALCTVAQGEGVLDDILQPLKILLMESGATGIHILFEDQAPDGWPRGIVTNAVPITGKLPLNYGSAGGYHYAHKLPPYTFHYEGRTFKTWNMQQELTGLLSSSPALNGFRVVDAEPVRQAVREQVRSSVRPEVAPPHPGTMNGMNAAEDDARKWQDFTDRWFEANPRYIAEPYGGISALARAMAEAEGQPDHNPYKSTAKEYFDRGLGDIHRAIDAMTAKE